MPGRLSYPAFLIRSNPLMLQCDEAHVLHSTQRAIQFVQGRPFPYR
ncbi:Uncharacterised protein [Serratia fonticola]|nr:Uncharacterised protein [Serratia fonticola]CAI1841464.1 Uncharacterised protein [Serratia fonticola]CAI1864410.1 Uncharacterised protein [Serratia fonticola]